jgi:hypothetical protein
MGDWTIEYEEDFEVETRGYPESVQKKLDAVGLVLEEFGPHLGRPTVDTLKGSKHANMKELRFSTADGVWRVAFAFDTRRRAILLAGGNKQGVGEKGFYRKLIKVADQRFDRHLARLGRGEGV